MPVKIFALLRRKKREKAEFFELSGPPYLAANSHTVRSSHLSSLMLMLYRILGECGNPVLAMNQSLTSAFTANLCNITRKCMEASSIYCCSYGFYLCSFDKEKYMCNLQFLCNSSTAHSSFSSS